MIVAMAELARPRTRWRAALHMPAWIAGLGAVAFLLGNVGATAGSVAGIACGALTIAAIALATRRVRERTLRPLRTAAGVLDALRHGDYTHRARADVVDSSLSQLLVDVNQLAAHLQAERGRAEEAAALLESLVERIDVALLAFDTGSNLRWWNPAAQRLFARLKAGASAHELGAEDLLSGASERSVVLGGCAAASVWELRRGAFYRAGERYQFVLLASSQRVRREEERAAWQRLVRVIGHEVNNTLAPIQSLAATCRLMLAEEGTHAVPDVVAALDVMEHRSAALSRFISEFSRLARLPEPRLTSIDLGAHVRRVVALDTRCPVRITGNQTVAVLADETLLEQALLNLVHNAVDASLLRQGAVSIDWHSDEENAVLSIIDEGPGIANPDNLFVPLFTTKPQGSGIGLVLARNIIEAHGGELTLNNRARAPGCVARVTLPRPARTDAIAPVAHE
jgi:two-component system, NtrC family, nitrogen regulation sensor histidine kinase NtrY